MPRSFAGTLTNTNLIELGGASNINPMIASDTQALALAFTTVGSTGTNPSITITFPAGFTVNATQTIANGSCTSLTGATNGLPGTLAASGSGQIITITSSGGSNSLSATTSYCTELTSTSAITNPSAGQYSPITINDGTDSESIGLDILTSGSNAYTVNATVAPSFSMALSATSDTFATNLSSTAVTVTSGVTTTIKTNAETGWFVWAADKNAGLTSAIASHNIPSASTGSNYSFSSNLGVEKYGLGVTAHNTANYAYGSGTTGGGLAIGTFNEIATNTIATASDTFNTVELANISPTTQPASDYTDTVTEIGSGSF